MDVPSALDENAVLAIFEFCDKNSDGVISEEELRSVLTTIGLPQHHVATLFKAADADEDGKINYTDFLAWIYGSAPALLQAKARTLLPYPASSWAAPCTETGCLSPSLAWDSLRKEVNDALPLLRASPLADARAEADRFDMQHSTLFHVFSADRRAFVLRLAEATKDEKLNRAIGCMVGAAVADILGAMFEFLDVSDKVLEKHNFDCDTFELTGPKDNFSLGLGCWTDDTSMTLCLADSIILSGHLNGSDVRLRFWNWWYNGLNNGWDKNAEKMKAARQEWKSSGTGAYLSVGLGGNVAASLKCIEEGTSPPPIYEASARGGAGNGSLVRNAPVSIFCHWDSDSFESSRRMAADQSLTTHPASLAAEACGFLTYVCTRAMQEGPKDPKRFLEDAAQKYTLLLGPAVGTDAQSMLRLLASSEPEDSTERCWNWMASSLEITRSLELRREHWPSCMTAADYFGSFCMDGLAVALWCVYHTDSFNRALERCVNFLGDADSNATICAQLAGSIYGFSSIDPRFLAWLRPVDRDEVALHAVLLYVMGADKASALRPAPKRRSASSAPKRRATSPAPKHRAASPVSTRTS